MTLNSKLYSLMASAVLAMAGVSAMTASAADNATLSRLEIKVDGRNLLPDFDPATKTYHIDLDEDASSIATFSAAPASKTAVVDININGADYSNHTLGSLRGGENVITYTVRDGGATETYVISVATPQVVRHEYFTWKNANIYFVLTDRFNNGDESNDESYHRHKTAGGNNTATFHGGDIKGLTEKLDYLDRLGVNAIWISAPYEQMHGWTGGKNDAFAHYAFHGYYTLDWTFMDRNMGTLDDMREFVTEAHRRGIRVVMDIVLNHTGYCTLDDCLDYDFGNIVGNAVPGWLPSGNSFTMWGGSEVSFTTATQGKWGDWWGSWVRAFGDCSWGASAGYVTPGNDDKTLSLSGLPDVVTERTQSVSIPAFLQRKWNAEKGGDYDAYRLPNIDEWRVSGKGAPADYIINWLAAWVEYFGIDGFRCDTAKHVELSRWNQLKNACSAALARWRASDRADEFARGWTDDFWMTGECFGWDHGDTGYFTQGGFDSMINFAFNGTEGGTGRTPSVDDWTYYSNYCNGSNGRQVLNYVSSHDTGLHRPSDMKNVATMLLLCPGGAQIYYGDETARPSVDGKGDAGMATRGDFNWSAVDNDLNLHWQKVGSFRRRNPAVGAGVQTALGSDTYGRRFSENGFDNAVVIRLNTSAGQTYTVDVTGCFAEGDKVMDGYNTENSAVVTGGKVTMTASGPVLLLEEYGTVDGPLPPVPPTPPTPSRPVVTATPADGTTFTDRISVSLNVTPAVDIRYTTDGTVPTASSALYTSPLTFTETTVLTTLAENEGGRTVKTFTYTKEQGGGDDDSKCYVYFLNEKNWSSVYVWAWDGSGSSCVRASSFPGDKMEIKNGVLYWEAPEGKVPTKIIFCDGANNDNRAGSNGNTNLDYYNHETYSADGSHSPVSYGPQKPAVTVTPAGGTFKGTRVISVKIDNEATSVSATFNNRNVTLDNGVTDVTIGDYLADGETATFSISASNSLGSTVWSADFTRDDSEPVYTLSGDWRQLSIYQIMVGSFQHADNGAAGYSDMWGPEGHRKNGNLRGIINSLDYIKDLGMNAIWMTPVFDSTNGTGGEKLQATGYFCTNYFKIDPKFGTEADFDELIREAHSRGIYVILDGVFGHHGGVNQNSPSGNRIDSNTSSNVRGTDAGNISYPNSLPYFKEVVRYWMERGVDGWRLDQCYQVYQGGHNYWNDLRLEVEAVAAERKARGEQWGTLGYMVGEDWTSAGNITVTQQDGLKSVMDFDGKDNLVNLSDGIRTIASFLTSDAAARGYRDAGVWPTLFLSNHDTSRVGDFVDINSNPKGLMTRHAAVAAYSGPSCTYYGDEIGDKSGNGNSDNKARTSGRLTGFTPNEQMVHDYVAKVFKARAENPALWRGDAQREDVSGNCVKITKTDSQSGNKVVVIFASADSEVSIGGTGLDLLSGNAVSGTVTVRAWEPAFIRMN